MENKKVSKKCGICGTTFYKKQNKSWKEWNEKAKYCSRRCSALSVRDQTIARNKAGAGRKLSDETKRKMSLRRKGKKPALGHVHTKEMRSRISEGIKKSWTKEKRLQYSLSRRSSKSHNWKGGRTSLKHRMRTTTKYIDWRMSVFVRDNFTCTHCGDNQGGNLEADHIITVKNIFDTFRLKTIDDVLGNFLLWETANGRTLCKDCHITRHSSVV